MRYVNQTSFTAAHIPGRLNFPGHSLTFVVKGTFDLHQGKPAEPADYQPYPTGDEFYPDDGDMTGGPRYEYDYAFFKPKADLLLVGALPSRRGETGSRMPDHFPGRTVLSVAVCFRQPFLERAAGAASHFRSRTVQNHGTPVRQQFRRSGRRAQPGRQRIRGTGKTPEEKANGSSPTSKTRNISSIRPTVVPNPPDTDRWGECGSIGHP